MSKCLSFKPSIDSNSKILILGSMPGVKSLNEKQYYAHPNNRFWKVMAYLCNYPNLDKESYDSKLNILLKNKIALWDTIKSCKRIGSLDSDIKKEIPNDILSLLKKYPNIKTICLNGGKSYSMFKKHFGELFQKYNCIHLPSTSPANAKFKLEDLNKQWSKILK